MRRWNAVDSEERPITGRGISSGPPHFRIIRCAGNNHGSEENPTPERRFPQARISIATSSAQRMLDMAGRRSILTASQFAGVISRQPEQTCPGMVPVKRGACSSKWMR